MGDTKKVLISGGMGFIGKFLVKKILSDTDYHITIVDNLSSCVIDKDIEQNKRITFFKADFTDWHTPEGEKYFQIYHLASPVGPVGVLKHKGRMGKLIINQLYKAAMMAVDMGAKLAEISTSEVYGKHPEDEKIGQRESIDKIVPSNITIRLEYGVAKLLGEIILKNLSKEYDLKYICARPFNIVGPSQNDDLGFVIPRFLRQTIQEEPITVYWDGKQKRTFTHVEDFVNGLFLVMESDITGEVFNIGNPNNVITILELAEKIKNIMKSKSEIIFVDPRTIFGENFAEAWNKIPNVEKLTKAVDWKPKWSIDGIISQIAELSGDYLIKR